MKVFDNKRLFLAIIVIFTLVNLAFVITVFYKVNDMRSDRNYRRDRDHRNSSTFMAKEIGFTEQQLEVFEKARKSFREKAGPLHKKLGDLNKQLITEVTSKNPDTVKCRQLSDQIGKVHYQFKMVSFNHFLEVRSIAKPSQIDKLNHFYREMFLDNNRYDRRKRPSIRQNSDSINK